MWSHETEKLRELYHTLYGLTQGMGLAVGIVAVAVACGLGVGGALMVGWVSSLVASAVWRWSWRRYRAAYRADLEIEKWWAE